MNALATIVVVLSCCSFLSALDVEFTNCFEDGDIGKASAVDISPCKVQPCPLKRGGNATVTIKFKPTAASKSVKGVVHGIIGILPVPFPIPNPDGCKDSGLSCPLKKDTEVTYHSSFPIKSIYPAMRLVVKYELQGDEGKNLACIKVSVHIQ